MPYFDIPASYEGRLPLELLLQEQAACILNPASGVMTTAPVRRHFSRTTFPSPFSYHPRSHPMHSSTWLIFKLAACSIALLPLFAHADIARTECSIFLTEQECYDFLQAQQKIQSPLEREVFESKYAALLKERAQLCPYPIGEAIPRAAKSTLPSKRFKSNNEKGRLCSQTMLVSHVVSH